MNTLFFDTETTGLPEWKLPSEDAAQPHLVQLASILVDDQTREQKARLDVIIRPDGWIIPEDVAAIHGITTERAMDEGIPEVDALDMYLDLYKICHLRAAHNTTFDNRIIRIALKRYRPDLVSDEEWKDKNLYFCTMLEYSKVYGGKWPKLEEAYEKLLGKKLEGGHNAMVDTVACMDIYFALQAIKAAMPANEVA